MRALVMIGEVAVIAFIAASAQADELTVNASAKRQMILCMTQGMTANKTLSYNDAQRECKQRLVARDPIATGKRALTADAADSPVLKTP